MKVLFDCSNISVGGGIQVADSMIRYAINSKKIEFCFIVSNSVGISIKDVLEKNHLVYILNTNQFTILPWHETNKKIKQILNDFRPNLIFTLFGPSYWRSNYTHLVGFARPHYVLHNSPFFKLKNHRKYIYYMKILEVIHGLLFKKNSDYLFVENNSMVDSLKSMYNKEVFYIPNTYNQIFENHEPLISNSQIVFKLLTISSNYPHKNLDSIPKIVEILRSKYSNFNFQFIVTINEDSTHISNQFVKYIGSVAIDDCPDLYKDCSAMFLPTMLECFSASYVEAMYMNIPILTSDLDFARSICSDAAIYFDPLNYSEIADSIYNLANDYNLQKELIGNGILQLSKFNTPETRFKIFEELFIRLGN